MKKRYGKNIFVVVLVITLILCSTVTAFAGMSNFTESNNYPGFSDISNSAWYYTDVNKSCKLGLFNGYPDGNFKPNGSITIAEAIKVAAVVRATYDGETAPTNYNTGDWYENYVSYAKTKGIIKSGDFTSYNKSAKRNEMAYIFANTLPSSEYKAINSVSALPDVTSSIKYSSNIFTLYNAGILKGYDDYGTFRPTDSITRAEVAAIINRVAITNNRVQFTLKVKDETPVEGGVMTEAQTVTYIRNYINNNTESKWLGRELSSSERQILAKIAADPKNCYPEFNSVENFNFTQQGASVSFYSNFITNVLMCGGDIDNYNDGQY